MDLNLEYASHQHALMRAEIATDCRDRADQLSRASGIAGRISTYQQKLGAAAACAWIIAQRSTAGRI